MKKINRRSFLAAAGLTAFLLLPALFLVPVAGKKRD